MLPFTTCLYLNSTCRLPLFYFCSHPRGPDRGLVTEYLAEATYIITGKAGIHFTVLTKLAAHKIVWRLDADHLEAIGHAGCTNTSPVTVLLGVFEVSFNVTHYRVQDLSFVQPVAIELCQLVFPVQLPFGEHVFLQCMVCFQDHHRSGCFESYAAFDTNDGIAYVNITAYAIRAGNGLQVLDGFGRMIK